MEAINSTAMSSTPIMEPGVVVDAARSEELIMAGNCIGTPEGRVVAGVGQPSGGTIVDATGSAAMSTTVVRRKRGRPRKSDVVGTGSSPVSAPAAALELPKRGRGRPKGSGKQQPVPYTGGSLIETMGENFNIQIVTVQIGEDIVTKILSFSQTSESVCVVSATGAVSSLVIRQPGSSGGTLRFEGIFEILSLKGLLSFGGGAVGTSRRPNIFSIVLAKPDGQVFGGCVAGPLVAAGPVQLVVGTFKECTMKERKVGRPRKFPIPVPAITANPDQALMSSGDVFNGTAILDDGSCEIPTSAGLETLLDAVEDRPPENN